MKEHNLIALEYNPDTGRMEPLSPDVLRDETSGWTVPPEGMPSRWSGLWRVTRKRALAENKPPEMAWYKANKAVYDAEVKWRGKAMKRFFRA